MVYFGQFLLSNKQVFFESAYCLGIVNLKPIVPGHILLIPKRVCPRLCELTSIEAAELFECVYKISPILENHYNAEALNIAVQDGKVAGQSVPHVHVHILPRKTGDFKRNDDIYDKLEAQNLDEIYKNEPVRLPRSLEEMSIEAYNLRLLFPNNLPKADDDDDDAEC